jgi:hypothetical protein
VRFALILNSQCYLGAMAPKRKTPDEDVAAELPLNCSNGAAVMLLLLLRLILLEEALVARRKKPSPLVHLQMQGGLPMRIWMLGCRQWTSLLTVLRPTRRKSAARLLEG